MVDQEKKKPKVALVIGSGGLKCAAALGIFEALEKENIGIDMVVGCSGGAIMGGFIVTGRSSTETIDLVNKMWDPKIVQQFRFKKILKLIFPKLLKFDETFGLTSDASMVNQYENAYGESTSFSDTKIPFYCVATDIRTGEAAVISEGRVADAVRMSSGFPILFEAIEHKNMFLLDGGLSNPLPVDVAIKEGANIIIAMGFENPKLPNVIGIGSFISQMFNILTNQLLSLKMAFYTHAHHSEIVVIIPEFDENISLTDVHKLPAIIEQGQIEAEKHIKYIKSLITSGFLNKEN
jgi:NTE family protein